MGQVSPENITPAHVKAARAFLDWNAQDLAGHCRVGVSTLRLFESGGTVRASSLQAIIDGLVSARITRDGVSLSLIHI